MVQEWLAGRLEAWASMLRKYAQTRREQEQHAEQLGGIMAGIFRLRSMGTGLVEGIADRLEQAAQRIKPKKPGAQT